jgi:hypothetical protein
MKFPSHKERHAFSLTHNIQIIRVIFMTHGLILRGLVQCQVLMAVITDEYCLLWRDFYQTTRCHIPRNYTLLSRVHSLVTNKWECYCNGGEHTTFESWIPTACKVQGVYSLSQTEGLAPGLSLPNVNDRAHTETCRLHSSWLPWTMYPVGCLNNTAVNPQKMM